VHYSYLGHVEILQQKIPELGVRRVKKKLEASRRDCKDRATECIPVSGKDIEMN